MHRGPERLAAALSHGDDAELSQDASARRASGDILPARICFRNGEVYWLNVLGDDPTGKPTHPATGTYEQVIHDGFLYSRESLIRLVQGYYQVFLQRLADPSGLNGWLTLLEQGGSFLSIGQGFLSSPEFYNNAL
jgi:hypothetical protein